MSGRPILSLRNLSKTFRNGGGSLEVLAEVDLDVAEGELVCLLGKSGCGKSTLLRLVAGFLSPDSGSVEVGGGRIAGPGPDRCVVFQEDALFPWLTVRENVAFGVMRTMPRKVRDAEVRRCLEKVGLEPFGGSLPREISGGMKQRVALARALVTRPCCMLADEPTGNLDAQTAASVFGLLHGLARQLGTAVVIVTHDLDLAARADRRVTLRDGTLVEAGV